MATPAVDQLVDEGVGLNTGNGLIDEGAVAITDPNFNQVEAEDRAGRVWDLGVELGVPLSDTQEHYNDFVLWDVPADPDSLSNDALNYNFIPSIEFVERTQPQLRAMTKEELRNFRKRPPLPKGALPIEKFDRMLHIIGDPALRIFYKLGKGMLLNSPEAGWAVLKKVAPDDMQEVMKGMTLDEAVDWAMDYNPGAVADFMSESAEFIGGISTVGKLLPQVGPGVVAQAGRGAAQFGGARGAKELAKLTAELVDPDTSYGYEGAKGVAEDMGIGTGFGVLASAAKPLKVAIAKTAFGEAIEEGAHKAAIALTKKFPILMDTIRKNPQAHFTKQVLRVVKDRTGKNTVNMTITEKAAIKHVAREGERRFLMAYRNYLKNIPPDVVRAVKKRGLALRQAPVRPPTAAPVAKVAAPLSQAWDKVKAKLVKERALGIYDESPVGGADILVEPLEKKPIIEEVRQNEGEEAAQIVKDLLDKEIHTIDTHVRPDEILVQIESSKSVPESVENLKILSDAGLLWEPEEGMTYVRIPRGSVPTQAKPPIDVEAKTQKIKTKALKDIAKAKQPRRLIEKEKTAELGKRAARSAKAAEQAAGEQRLNAALGQLKGPLTDYKRPDFTPLKETMSQEEIDILHDDIWVRPHSPDHFDMLGTAKAWSKVTEGFVPTRGEILLLEKQWGPGFARALLKKRPLGDRAWDTAADVSNFMRTMIAGGDISVAGRQLRVLGQAYPLEWGKAVTKGLGAYKSEKLAELMRKEYAASDFHKEAKRYVQFFDPAGTVTTPPSERPEWYMSQYPEQVPVLGHLIRMGNRNYVETMNMFTQDVWDKLRAQDLRNGVEPTEEQLALRGKWLMSMTGRPEIGGVVGRRIAPIASGFFFAPRFAVSRFSSPTYLRHLANGDPVAREVGRNTAIAFSSFIGTNIAIISLLKLAYGDKVEVEMDPRSPDWGKVRIGNTRIDLWAGHQQAARFMVQMALGEYKTQSGKIKETGRLELIGRFIRGKENPLVSLISDLYKGKTYEGDRPFSPPEGEMGKILDELQVPELIQGIGKEAYRRMLFMWAQDFLEATANDGWLLGFTAGTLSFFGFNTASYEDTAFTKIAEFKNAIAQTEHGRDWNDLNSSQQARLSRINKQVFAEMELQANIEGARRDDYDYVGRLIEDEKKAGKKVYKKLSPANRKLLDEAGISLGLSKKIGDWEISDERYEQYQNITAELLEAKLSKLADITGWENLPNSRKIVKIELAVQIAKDKAKSQVRREAKKIP